MLFESRELKPYAEPVSMSELQEGSVYFLVTFVDDDMLVPIMETLVFAGKRDDGNLRFQDVESYRHGMRYDSAGPEHRATVFECSEDQLNCIFEFEHALDLLLACSLRRRNTA